MNLKSSFYLALCLVAGLIALFSMIPLASSSPDLQADATDQQATIDALVREWFLATQQAEGVPLTATAEAQQTRSAASGPTMTAAFQQTAMAAFAQAQTATAAAAQPQVAPTPAPVDIDALELEGAQAIRIHLAPVDPVSDEDLALAAGIVQRRLQESGIPAVASAKNEGVIRVDILPVADLENVLVSIQRAGLLEFVDLSGLSDQINEFVDQVLATEFGPDREGALLNPLTDQPFDTVVTGADVRNAVAVQDAQGNWQVRFDFTEQAGRRLARFTREHVGEPLAIVVDGQVLSIPIIQGEFGRSGGVLSGGFSQEDAERLALQLNFGALPISLYADDINPLNRVLDDLQAVIDEMTAAGAVASSQLLAPGTQGQIQVVEQVFENGRMFYIQPRDQIWVLQATGEGRGEWSVYPDTFEEGDPEVDPSLIAPEGMLQPVRGFGKLWRENDEVREGLGWAITPEFGYVSPYEYYPGGETVDGEFVPGPGFHVLYSLEGQAFRFNEADNTWELYGG